MEILFLGMYFSQSRGTTPVIERVSNYLSSQSNFSINISSSRQNKFIRLFDLASSALLFDGDLVFIDVFSGYSFYIAILCNLLAKARGTTTIGILRGGKLPEFCLHNQFLTRYLFDNFNHIISPSNFLCDFYSQWNYQIQYLPNPINLKQFPYTVRDQIQVDKQLRLLWVRAFSPIYNPMIPIKVLSILKNSYPDVHLTMIGPDLGLLPSIRSLVQQLNLIDHVSFTGPVPNAELSNYFKRHDIFLNTTSYESFGMSVLEAASSGIPIVSSNVGEIPLLWEANSEILLADTMSPESFVTQIIKLVESPSLLESISNNAKAKSMRFDWNIIKGEWIKLLEEYGPTY